MLTSQIILTQKRLKQIWASPFIATHRLRRVSRLRRSRARALPLLNLKKKRDCSQSTCSVATIHSLDYVVAPLFTVTRNPPVQVQINGYICLPWLARRLITIVEEPFWGTSWFSQQTDEYLFNWLLLILQSGDTKLAQLVFYNSLLDQC